MKIEWVPNWWWSIRRQRIEAWASSSLGGRAQSTFQPALKRSAPLLRSANIWAMSAWSRWRTLTRKWVTPPNGAWTEAARLMQMSRLGGSIEIDETAVAVIPIGAPSTQIEITFTVEATRRIAWRKSADSPGSVSIMPGSHGARPRRLQ